MATFTKTISDYYGLNCRVTWSETVNQSDNTSTVSVTKVELSSSEMAGTFYATGYITINGVKVSSFSSKAFYVNGTASYYSTLSGATGSGTVAHNSDGTGSTTISVTITSIYDWSKWSSASASQSVTLTKIDRGLVYIDTGSGFIACQIYIDDGTTWSVYAPNIDLGSAWALCS